MLNLKNGLKFFFIIGHQRKSPFCTFSCINPGFGRPWDMLRKNFLIAIFIMVQKNTFGQKNFWISCTGSKLPLWQFFIFAKMALLNPCMKLNFFFAKSILLKHNENANKNFFYVSWPRVRQIQDLCRKKYKKVIF